jgi:hypothetical protein
VQFFESQARVWQPGSQPARGWLSQAARAAAVHQVEGQCPPAISRKAGTAGATAGAGAALRAREARNCWSAGLGAGAAGAAVPDTAMLRQRVSITIRVWVVFFKRGLL